MGVNSGEITIDACLGSASAVIRDYAKKLGIDIGKVELCSRIKRIELVMASTSGNLLVETDLWIQFGDNSDILFSDNRPIIK
jgi:hypothetical protein